MSLTRKAILIGSSAGGLPLRGVYNDVKNMYAYLRSLTGGAWAPMEVDLLKDPSKPAIQSAVAEAGRADYSLVLFAGHGESIRVPGTPSLPFGSAATTVSMGCSGGESITTQEITPKSQRSLIILDCCRGLDVRDRVDLSVEIRKAHVHHFTEHERWIRARFDAALEQAEKGTIRVYGCEFNGSASDRNSFTSHLIGAGNSVAHHRNMVFDINDCFGMASRTHSRVEPGITPDIDLGRRKVAFPFAVTTA